MKSLPRPLSILLIAGIIFFYSQPYTFSQSPYKLDLKKETAIFGIGAVLTAVTLPLNSNIKPLTSEEIYLLDRNDVNSFDRRATFNWSPNAGSASDYLLAAAIISPVLLSMSEKVRNDFTPVLTMYIEVLIYSDVIPFLAKAVTNRVRPFAYNENVPFDNKKTKDAKRSFFSGHTTTAFAMATFLSTVYSDYYPDSDWRPVLWGSTLLLASIDGYLRYSSGSHFPTDILTGAIVGSAIGYFIPAMHRSNENNYNLSFGFNGPGKFINFHYTF